MAKPDFVHGQQVWILMGTPWRPVLCMFVKAELDRRKWLCHLIKRGDDFTFDAEPENVYSSFDEAQRAAALHTLAGY